MRCLSEGRRLLEGGAYFDVDKQRWRRSGVFIVNFEHIFTLLKSFYCERWAGKCRLGIAF